MIRRLAIILALAVALGPFVVLMVNSVRPSDAFLAPGAGFIPGTITLDHYRAVFGGDGETLRFLANSVIIATATTLLALLLGAPAAYALARARLPFRLSIVFALAFLIVRFYPKITVALPYYLIMRDLGWLDTHLAVILAHVSVTVPFVVWLMLGFLEELPPEIEQSAMMDGCNAWGRFVRVVLPLSMPALGAAAVLTAFTSWNEFLLASTVASNDAKTLPVRISSFITDKGILWGNMAAMGTVIVLPVALFAFATQRYLVRGLTVGAVKG
ncbi:MAG: carbohydrate ABC transporter permease [Rubellimicrobium sp.]|nr:carbohydrate ABC transporter permease [Rubellimicrobium sp.]